MGQKPQHTTQQVQRPDYSGMDMNQLAAMAYIQSNSNNYGYNNMQLQNLNFLKKAAHKVSHNVIKPVTHTADKYVVKPIIVKNANDLVSSGGAIVKDGAHVGKDLAHGKVDHALHDTFQGAKDIYALNSKYNPYGDNFGAQIALDTAAGYKTILLI